MGRERNTDVMVARLLGEAGIKFSAEVSGIRDVDEALRSASKRGTGNFGSPEFLAQVNDFLLVVEDKRDTDRHIKFADDSTIDMSVDAVKNYAVNGAVHYAQHIAEHTQFKKIFAVGVSGDDVHYMIQPVFCGGGAA